MNPIERFKLKIEEIKRRHKESLAATEIVTLNIQQLLNWIMSPREPLDDNGIITPRIVHNELAEWLEKQPAFHKYCVIEREDGEIYLWRKADWDRHIPVEMAKREMNIAESVASCEARERFDRALVSLCESGPAFKNNIALARRAIETLVHKSNEGDERSIEMLEKFGYNLKE